MNNTFAWVAAARLQPASAASRRIAVPLLVVAIVILAASLRLWRLEKAPPGLYHDEAYYGLDALSLLRGDTFPNFYEGWELYAQDAHANRPPAPARFPVFFEGNYGREPLHVYLVALSIKLFGPTPFAIRFVPAIAGTVAVFTTYLAALALFGGQRPAISGQSSATGIALLSALTLAILYPALTFSRFGIRAMLFLPFATLAVYCFWQALNRTPDQISPAPLLLSSPAPWFLAAGFFLGASLYTYAAARLLPLLFVVFVPVWFWQDRQALPKQWRNVSLMAVAAFVTAAPLLLFFLRYPYFFVFRTAYVANKGLGTVPDMPWLTWLGNVGRVTLGLFWQGETHLRHNLPGRPYLDPVQFVFFLVGLFHTVRYRLHLRFAFLFIWLVVMLLPTILSGDAPHFGRMAGAAPVIAILVAVGVHRLWQRIEGVGSGEWGIGASPTSYSPLPTHNLLKLASRHSIAFVIGLLFLASAALMVRDYFYRYANHPDLAGAFYVSDWRLGRYAAAQPAEATLYLTPTQEEMATIYFAIGEQWERLRSYYGPGGLIPAGRPETAAVYLVRPSDGESLVRLAEFFPEGWREPPQDGFLPFIVPPAAPRVKSDELTAISWDRRISLRGWSAYAHPNELVVDLYWQAEAYVPYSYTAYVHLLDANGDLVAQLDRPPAGYPTSDWQPGEIIVDWYRIPLPTELPPGEYHLQTGFYYLPTLEPLGEPALLGSLRLP